MRSSELDYSLPRELIAQRPLERRDSSRLLVYERASGEVRHRRFDELLGELAAATLTVVNDTRVLPARLRLERPGGGEAEVLLLERGGAGALDAARARGRHDDWASARVACAGSAARGEDVAVRDAGLRVPSGRRAPDELPPAALDPACARDGIRGRRGDPAPLPDRDRGAVSLLLVRRRDARPVNGGSAVGRGEIATQSARFRARRVRLPRVRSQRHRASPPNPTPRT